MLLSPSWPIAVAAVGPMARDPEVRSLLHRQAEQMPTIERLLAQLDNFAETLSTFVRIRQEERAATAKETGSPGTSGGTHGEDDKT